MPKQCHDVQLLLKIANLVKRIAFDVVLSSFCYTTVKGSMIQTGNNTLGM